MRTHSRREKWARRLLAPSLGVIVGAAFVFAIISRVDVHAVGAVLAAANPVWIVVAVACALMGLTIRAFRWWLMLRAIRAPVDYITSLRVFFGSFALNNVMPLRLGDVVRAFGFSSNLKCSPWAIAGTLVTERTLDLMVLIALSAFVIRFVPASVLPTNIGGALEGIVAVAIASLVCMFFFNRPIRSLLEGRRCREAAHRFTVTEYVRRRVVHVLEATAHSSSPTILPSLVLLSIAGWMCEGLVFIAVFAALGLAPNAAAALLGFGCGTLGTMLPGPPGNFGTFDFLAIRGLIASGIQSVPATAVTLLAHLVIWAPVTLIGGLLLLAISPNWRRRIAPTVSE